MSFDDRLLAAFLDLAAVERPELAALQAELPLSEDRPRDDIEVAERPRQNLRQMLAEIQAVAPELPIGEPGWEATRPVWPDTWFEARDPGDADACRRLWSRALLECIRDTVRESGDRSSYLGATQTGRGWIGSRDFYEMCVLAGVEGAAVAERLARLDADPELRARLIGAAVDHD